MFEEPDGATPLDPDEADALLPAHIHTRAELNLWEQANILEAARWAVRARAQALADSTVRELHRRMFDETWAWAGRYRTSDKNIGVNWPTISTEVRKLLDDGQYWLDHGTYAIDEAAARLHHRLVKVHPFPNGTLASGATWCCANTVGHRLTGRAANWTRTERREQPTSGRFARQTAKTMCRS
jgi:Fic-DOC domain mobile mystery protein B